MRYFSPTGGAYLLDRCPVRFLRGPDPAHCLLPGVLLDRCEDGVGHGRPWLHVLHVRAPGLRGCGFQALRF